LTDSFARHNDFSHIERLSDKPITEVTTMPLYEYKCPECGERFEEIRPFSRADEVTCESCGYEKPERLMSTFATGAASAGGASRSSCSTSSSGFS